MYLLSLKSEGLAHLSYVIGNDSQIIVIDPKRDISEYCEIASDKGAAITHIFETHRNEDYVVGSIPLAEKTGAEIWHGSQLPFEYGNAASDDQIFDFEEFKLKVINTPGHTDESISIAIYDSAFGDEAVGVFTGDALFVGDVGRTDFFPDRADEVAENLYDSIFKKLLPLGDQALIYPAHGAGSVCGSGMASREFSSLGYERKFNPKLQLARKEFVSYKTNEHHYKPPYFSKMEEYNLKGPKLSAIPIPWPVSTSQLIDALCNGAQAVDIRTPEAFGGAFIPGSVAIPSDMLPVYAGWLLNYDEDIILVGDENTCIDTAIINLYRIGYDRVHSFLHGGIQSWETSGNKFDHIPGIFAGDLTEKLKAGDNLTVLDVRKKEEFEDGHLPGALHIFLGHLPDRLDEIPRDKPVITFCDSGRRAMIATSILKKAGFEQVENCFGSIAACKKLDCKIIS
jgi:hydroxyacylglutathione hydrolase